jgi:pimeloyl-ACP methyl ester carboxylesterase
MSSQRTHFVTTTDGVTIGGTVHGQGPPLVFLHGAFGDGDLEWQALLPHLTDRFTCHLPSWRGRGLSDDHPDVSLGRRVDDVLAYVDSIGAATGVVGLFGGAWFALAAAEARPEAVTAVASVGTAVFNLMDEREQAALRDAVARTGELAAEGRLTDAMRAFAGSFFHDWEIAVAEDAGYLEAAGRYAPNLLNVFQQLKEYNGPDLDDPAVLATISAPVLVVHGPESKPLWKPFFTRSARHVADHVPNATMHEIPGAGIVAPLTHPDALAVAFVEFFSPAQQSA